MPAKTRDIKTTAAAIAPYNHVGSITCHFFSQSAFSRSPPSVCLSSVYFVCPYRLCLSIVSFVCRFCLSLLSVAFVCRFCLSLLSVYRFRLSIASIIFLTISLYFLFLFPPL
ncbi:hypothetical protein H0G86_000750 [Trichoderma simmonsii]|uniref:Transmembrane protein n=1 Tax=Trichoderma simmonsii TaxID=1491479 RepID=A0A8G0L083_9HYPO|nr:hypothetical protein H0G86_000750 [Trichoderma simmonsii]